MTLRRFFTLRPFLIISLFVSFAVAAFAQVDTTGKITTGTGVEPSHISFKSSSFKVAGETVVKDFRPGSSQLQGARGVGRLFLLTQPTQGCNHASYTVYVNTAAKNEKDNWVKAAELNCFSSLTVHNEIFGNQYLSFAVNGSMIHPTGEDITIGNSGISHYYIQVFEKSDDQCRKYKAVYGADSIHADDEPDYVSIDLPWSPHRPQVANGIVVGAPKVYDTYALMSLRNDALQKIRAVNPFLATSITNAYGNVQGVTRDQSYLSVQATGGTPAAGNPVTSITNSQITCPAGYYPYGSNACSPVTGTSSSPVTATSSSETITPVTPTAPTIPAAPASSPLAAPTNIGPSASDVLVEQVELNAQLQMYQLLLEGAQSDALFVQNSRAISNRAQTTVAFPISIDPPRQYRHAVAEVRVLIEPYPSANSDRTEPVSIVNLLPSQKTYNVAKITSKQHAFGGAAVIEQVANVGVNTGKAKDRLYLAKDTDTVALQYDHPSVGNLHTPFPERAATGIESAFHMQRLDDCQSEWFAVDGVEDRKAIDNKNSRDNSVLFGWQFRPVLGADYVAGGPRQVFAQLALPTALEDTTFLPAVIVQTRWREYDEKRQVVGPVFHSSCTVTPIKDPVIIQNPLRVTDTTWDDAGNGLLAIRAHGTFLSPGISLQSGNKTYPPITFDGHDVQFFAPAKDVLNNGDLNILSENNHATSLTIPLLSEHAGCNIAESALWAIPRSDGSANLTLALWPGENFQKEMPNAKPLVAIGADVYGLKEKPFEKGKSCDAKGVCLYRFNASADALREATNYYVRDISWSNSKGAGPIRFAPMLAALSKYDDAAKTTTFMVAGSDLKKLANEKLKVYSSGSSDGTPPKSFIVISDSKAVLTLAQIPKGKTITVAWNPTDWPLKNEAPIVWDLALPTDEPAPSIVSTPAFVYAGDSRSVTFSGADLSTVQSISFESVPRLTFNVSADDPKSIDVLLPTSITREPGHKELIAIAKDKKGKKSTLILPIDVFRR